MSLATLFWSIWQDLLRPFAYAGFTAPGYARFVEWVTALARCPNRAATVRAHNWVVLGALLHDPDQPAWFLPIAGRLYFRRSQLPECPDAPGRRAAFRTKCELAVELLRQQAGSPGDGTWASS